MFKKITKVTVALAIVASLGVSTTSNAAPSIAVPTPAYNSDGTSQSALVQNASKSGNVESSIDVTADLSKGFYFVTMPVKIALAQDVKNPQLFYNEFNVGCWGIIKKDKVVKIIPHGNDTISTNDTNGDTASTVNLYSANLGKAKIDELTSDGKLTTENTVSNNTKIKGAEKLGFISHENDGQETRYVVLKNTDDNDYQKMPITVTAIPKVAGTYNGTINFTLSYSDM